MNEFIIENYLNVLQDGEPEYMTEGIREFVAKFDKVMLKKTIDKLHRAFSQKDGDSFDEVAKKIGQIKKIPKYQEVKTYMKNFGEENPKIGEAKELSLKVLRNTFKIKDKAKLEILSNAVGMTAWIKSKAGRYDVMKTTKVALQDIASRVSNIYDGGFENMATDTPEEERMKEKMMEKSKKQEKIEMVVVGVVLAVLVAAFIWAGITIWGIITSPVAAGIAAIIAITIIVFKSLMWALMVTTPVVLAITAFQKAKGG